MRNIISGQIKIMVFNNDLLPSKTRGQNVHCIICVSAAKLIKLKKLNYNTKAIDFEYSFKESMAFLLKFRV